MTKIAMFSHPQCHAQLLMYHKVLQLRVGSAFPIIDSERYVAVNDVFVLYDLNVH